MYTYDVIVCSHEGVDFIEEQLRSILSQTIKPHKIIVSDDSVSPETIIKAKDVLNNDLDIDYLIIKGPQEGVTSNFLSAFKYSCSDFLFFSDQDDIWECNKVEFFFQLVKGEQINEKLLIFSDASLIDECGNKIAGSFIKKQGLRVEILSDDSIQLENCIQGAACCINSHLRELINQAIESLDSQTIIMHDWLIAMIARYSSYIIYTDEKLLNYRIHRNNQIGYIGIYRKIINFICSPQRFCLKINDYLIQRNAILNFLLTNEYITKDTLTNPNLSKLQRYKRVIFRLLMYINKT